MATTLDTLEDRIAALEAWVQIPVQHIPGYVIPEGSAPADPVPAQEPVATA